MSRQRAAAAGSCVTMTTVIAFVRAKSASIRQICSLLVESRFPVGSSARRVLGSSSKALASAIRCCSPPDSASGRWWIRSVSLTCSNRVMVRS